MIELSIISGLDIFIFRKQMHLEVEGKGEDPTSYISTIFSHLQAPLKTISQLSQIHKTGQSVTLPKTPCRWRKGLRLKDTVWKSKKRTWNIFLLSLMSMKTSSLQVVSNTLLKVKLAKVSSDFSLGGEPGESTSYKWTRLPSWSFSNTIESAKFGLPTKPVTTNGGLGAAAVPLFDMHNV